MGAPFALYPHAPGYGVRGKLNTLRALLSTTRLATSSCSVTRSALTIHVALFLTLPSCWHSRAGLASVRPRRVRLRELVVHGSARAA